MLMHLQIAALADDVRAHGPARIVAGDLNATPWNDSHRTLSAFLTDAFGVAGTGPGFTFPTRARRLGFAFPYLRIDHIFVDAALYPVAAQVGIASPGADHLPVVADLVRRPALQQNGE
jgi:endonuclease/exonuclease/phosphatase (EEP) superfamily protein YafD